MSKIADQIQTILKKEFPNNVIIPEYYVWYKGYRLFFDFYIKDLGVLVEVQGQQHLKFNSHFYDGKESFLKQKKRDRAKIEYVKEHEEYCLVRFYYDEDFSSQMVINKIYNALEEGFYE